VVAAGWAEDVRGGGGDLLPLTLKVAEDEEGGQEDLSPGRLHGGRRSGASSPARRRRRCGAARRSGDATLERHCNFNRRRAWRVGGDEMSRAIARGSGWSYKKKDAGGPPGTTKGRGSWRERAEGIDAETVGLRGPNPQPRIAFTRALRQGAQGRWPWQAPRNWGKNVTLISSITLSGMGPSMSIEGSSDTESSASAEEHSDPAEARADRGDGPLGALGADGSEGAHRRAGCQLWLLPSYSPDFNPIEEAFSKVKRASWGGQGARTHSGTLQKPRRALRQSAGKMPGATSCSPTASQDH